MKTPVTTQPSTTVAPPDSVLDRLTPSWKYSVKVPAPVVATAVKARRRAAVYMRYSTDLQDPYSFTRQLEKAKAYAESIDVDVVKIYGDPGQSGAYTANRPNFLEMIEAAKRSEFDLVIIEEGDRLSRKLHITTAVFNTLSVHGIELHSSKVGRWTLLHAAFSGLMSDEQRTRMHELMHSGVIKIVKRGLWPSRTPFGYERVPGSPGELRINEKTAAVVRRMFELRKSGLSPLTIAHILNKEKVPGPKRSNWSAVAIYKVLRNPIYTGIVLYNRTDQKVIQINDNTILSNRREMRPMSEWISSERPDWVIVSLADWQEVQAVRKPGRRRGTTPKYLVSQLVHCARCGKRMHTGGKYAGRTWTRCQYKSLRYELALDDPGPGCDSKPVLLDTLEDNLVGFVCEKLDSAEALKEMQAGYDEKINEQGDAMNRERHRLENEKSAIHQKLDATFDAAMVAGLTTEIVRGQRENYCARIEEIDRRLSEIPRVSLARKQLLETPLETSMLLSELTPMRNYRDCPEDLAKLVAIFRTLVERVDVDRKKGSNTVSVTLHGPIASISGPNQFTFEHETRFARHIELANDQLRDGLIRLGDEEWEQIALHFPFDSIWIEEFDNPIDLRSVIDAVIFAKRTKVGIGNISDHFGTKRQVWAAARMLNFAGALDEIENLMRDKGITQVEGISLSLEAKRSKRTDAWARVVKWNERRKQRVRARLAKEAAAKQVMHVGPV